MRWIFSILAFLLVPVASARPLFETQVSVLRDDASTLDLRIVAPRGAGSRPVILLSHGNGLTPGDYEPLVGALARAGFILILPAHPDATVRPNPPGLWRRRIGDLSQAIDALGAVEEALAEAGTLPDRARIGALGHSFGGHSVAALMGLRVRGSGGWFSAPDPRVRAAMLLAPPGGYAGLTPEWRARAPYLETDGAAMRGPLLVVTGTADASPMTRLGPVWQEGIYARAATPDKCLVRIAGAEHDFGGIARRLDGQTLIVRSHQRAVIAAARRFFTATLSGRRFDCPRDNRSADSPRRRIAALPSPQ